MYLFHFLAGLIHGELHALDLVHAVKSAVRAVARAVVGKVDRRVKRDRAAEVLLGNASRVLGKRFKRFRAGVG